MRRGAHFSAPMCAGILLLALLAPTRALSSAFCDCCCNAAAGTRAPCAGCDVDGSGTVTLTELSLLGCASNPICAALFPVTPSPTPTVAACVGDCHGKRQVTIDDLLIMVNVLLGTRDVGGCLPGDANRDGMIAINEIVSAVANSLNGCPPPPATATATTFQPRPTLTAMPTGTMVPFTATAAVSPSGTQPATAVPTGTSSATLVPITSSPSAPATSPPPGSDTPTRSATAGPSTPTVTATQTASATTKPVASATATITASPTRTGAPTVSSTATAAMTTTATFTRTATVTPSATRTAPASPTPTLTATAIPTPTLSAGSVLYCDTLSGPALIPDDTPSGINNTIVVPGGPTIADLNVQLDINHPYVGDLVVTLRHNDTGTMVTLINRPGIPATDAGCGGSDISCTLDDQAGRVAQNECQSAAPAIDGSVQPAGALSAFAGQAAAGTWRLSVSDNAPDDVGSLFGWCLVVNSAAPVVTAYTCEGTEECALNIDDSFTQSFSFTAPHGATSWRITAVRDDGMPLDIGSGVISPPSTDGTIPLTFNPFTCQQGPCRTTEYDYFLVVTDALGADSPGARVHVVVLGNASPTVAAEDDEPHLISGPSQLH